MSLISIQEASAWVSERFKRRVSAHNISYLINYGHIKKIKKNNKNYVLLEDIERYYKELELKEKVYKEKYKDISWELSFDWVSEKERTKHVHRLHPYKGKFIPQLVEYFLDEHTDNLKKDVYFKKGDIVIDPFCGSGTTLVQANELGIHSIGVDISPFNAFIANTKLIDIDIDKLEQTLEDINKKLNEFISSKEYVLFEEELNEKLIEFNNKFFPSPEFKIKVRNKEIDEKKYSKEKEKEFLKFLKN